MINRTIYLIAAVLLAVSTVQAILIKDGDQSAFVSEFLSVHNAYRKSVSHSIPDLKWDTNLEAFAKKTVKKCVMSHTSHQSRSNLGGFDYVGENLASGASSQYTKNNISRFPISKQGMKQWFDEQEDYDYSTNSCQPGKQCGHYTQMVWNSSTSIGCAIEACPGLFGMNWGWVMACNYGPGGNYEGEHPYLISQKNDQNGHSVNYLAKRSDQKALGAFILSASFCLLVLLSIIAL